MSSAASFVLNLRMPIGSRLSVRALRHPGNVVDELLCLIRHGSLAVRPACMRHKRMGREHPGQEIRRLPISPGRGGRRNNGVWCSCPILRQGAHPRHAPKQGLAATGKGRPSFLKKRSKRLLCRCRGSLRQRTLRKQKVFCFPAGRAPHSP